MDGDYARHDFPIRQDALPRCNLLVDGSTLLPHSISGYTGFLAVNSEEPMLIAQPAKKHCWPQHGDIRRRSYRRCHSTWARSSVDGSVAASCVCELFLVASSVAWIRVATHIGGHVVCGGRRDMRSLGRRRGRSNGVFGDHLDRIRVSLAEGLGPDSSRQYEARRRKLQRIEEVLHHKDEFVQGEFIMQWYSRGAQFLQCVDRCDSNRTGVVDAPAEAGFSSASGVPIEQLRGEDATIRADLWDELLGPGDSPFLEHAFLSALEEAGCVSLESGWQPRYLLAFDEEFCSGRRSRLVGAVPLYVKEHLCGEFCDEEGWVEAAHRLGVQEIEHRIFVGVPFTPHRGRRFLSAHWLSLPEQKKVEQALVQALIRISKCTKLPVNVAFCTQEEGEQLRTAGFVRRQGRQAWWQNRRPRPYESFADFLGELRGKKARAIEKQRAVLAGTEGLHIEVIDGSANPDAVSPDLMAEAFRVCYESTQKRFGGQICLNEDFFRLLGTRFAHRVLLVLASETAAGAHRSELVGGSLSFAKGGQICGRYWGHPPEKEPVDYLYFECCYHLIIEHAIRFGYTVFEPGNGGASIFDIQRDRGFEPVELPSYFFVPGTELRDEVSKFARLAAQQVPSWTKRTHSAYKPGALTSVPPEAVGETLPTKHRASAK